MGWSGALFSLVILSIIHPTAEAAAPSSHQKLFACLVEVVKLQNRIDKNFYSSKVQQGSTFGIPLTWTKNNSIDAVLVSQIPVISKGKEAEGFVVITPSTFNCHQLPDKPTVDYPMKITSVRARQWAPMELSYPKSILPQGPIRFVFESNEEGISPCPGCDPAEWDEGDKISKYTGNKKAIKLPPHSCLDENSPERRAVIDTLRRVLHGYSSTSGQGYRTSIPDYEYRDNEKPGKKDIAEAKDLQGVIEKCRLIGDTGLNQHLDAVSEYIEKYLGGVSQKDKPSAKSREQDQHSVK